ncbi:THUMP-like domain-containing protein [Lutimonas sp.]|uniref:THUMP-like domain-containing protein n=1 Tax=Lutimonas sp. TaxID=1872403 RepID=UPI003D9BA919
MNQGVLHTETQEFINNQLHADLSKLILKGSPFKEVTIQELADQLKSKLKSKHKLPSWFETEGIYYPKPLSIEQTSSERTAAYKASLITGESIIDLTGGFGVDSFFFAKKFSSLTHCEINSELSEIVAYNYTKLGVKNCHCLAIDGIEKLKADPTTYDWIYVDPSRRDDLKSKVFQVEDCLPDISLHLDLLLERSTNIMVKLSPFLDISSTINRLKFIKEIHIIAVKNDVKELLFLIQKGYSNPIKIKTVNMLKEAEQVFEGRYPSRAEASISHPLHFLYEPNTALLKSGLFNEVSHDLKIHKLHTNSHLYTSETLIHFPGRCFLISNVFKYSKKLIKKHVTGSKANITTRNFRESVAQIRKKTGIKEGGDDYLFFTTDMDNKAIVILCKKV